MSPTDHRQHHARNRTPVPTDKDLELWRRLIARANKMARAPLSNALALDGAARRAAKAVMPVGHQTVDSPFHQLVLLAGAWLVMPLDAARELGAARLQRLAAECQAILTAPPPERRTRADIDG
jgi:hypothetical protein